MKMQLPEDVSEVLAPLFNALPFNEAMRQLVVQQGGDDEAAALVNQLSREAALAARPALLAGLWLYVDELDRSHTISQSISDATGSFWHGIMHRREGDFGNSHYWFRRTGAHPAMARIDGYDAHRLIDKVEAAHRKGEQPEALIDLQRREWRALFEWCAAR